MNLVRPMWDDAAQPAVADVLKLGERAVRVLEESKALSPKADNSTPKLTVETFDNHVYFYADVDSDRCLAMIKTIRDLDSRLRSERVTRNVPSDVGLTPIWLHIQSGGGSLFAGLATADQLNLIQTPVYSVIEGICASAATLLSLSCHRRYIMPNGFMLIHQFSSVHWGTYEEFVDEMKLQNMLIELMVGFYSTRTKLTRRNVRQILKHDSWYSARQCVEHGLVDEIYAG